MEWSNICVILFIHSRIYKAPLQEIYSEANNRGVYKVFIIVFQSLNQYLLKNIHLYWFHLTPNTIVKLVFSLQRKTCMRMLAYTNLSVVFETQINAVQLLYIQYQYLLNSTYVFQLLNILIFGTLQFSRCLFITECINIDFV